jgi:zinc transport system substrate-binding protein
MIPVLKEVLALSLPMWKLSALLVALALALVGCGGADKNSAASNTLVAAFYPLAWAAEQVAGDDARVVNLTPPGAEPHDVELSPRDVEAVHDADLVLYLGSGFQPALERAIGTRSAPSLDLLEGQDLMVGLDEEGREAQDPHVWLDPARFAEMVTAIARELGDEGGAADLAARLRALDDETADGLETCERREIVTSHTAFGYLAKRYDLAQIGLTGLSPEAEPSPRDLVGLVDKVDDSGATTVFFETLVSPRLAQTVARESGAKTAVLDPIEGLTEAEVSAGEDYFSVMRANLAALREALGCR